ncbi:MAG TPA: intradiol ring-cleavage dioxygenase [bacterium]|nr:intradiol ring-cleavage dioxygenase [bacterium]
MESFAIERTLTQTAIRRMAKAKDARLKQVMTRLLQHLHDFVREVELTEAEWFKAIQFLTETGHMCDDKRQEFILLSDVLGVSMLVDAINHRKPAGATESTVLGPFYVKGAKFLPKGASIWRGKGGKPTLVSGRVLAADGTPITGAVLDVWQTGPNGLYDVQDPHLKGMNLRGKFRTDAQGRFAFKTVRPETYPIPSDGPVGKLLRQLKRHPYRPAHLHFMVSAKGYQPLTTHLFVKGGPYLDSDAVFGVKRSLIVPFVRHDRAPADKRSLEGRMKPPYYTLTYDFRLSPAAMAKRRRAA